jgi:hypothetical protein
LELEPHPERGQRGVRDNTTSHLRGDRLHAVWKRKTSTKTVEIVVHNENIRHITVWRDHVDKLSLGSIVAIKVQ